MEEYNEWATPENIFMVFRCTTAKYADTFLSKGEIKFNTPSSWVKYAFEKGDGRGDKLEGTMATFHKLNSLNASLLNKKYKIYSDLMSVNIDDRIYLKRARDMELPCFCFYILKQNMFKCPNKEGIHKLTTIIPASYFRDFMDNLEPCEVDKSDKEDRPAVIIINNYKEFERRVLLKLMSFGLKREEIIITRIHYMDFNKNGEYHWWDFNQTPPMELTIKDQRFETQSEARIIINTDDAKIKKILDKPFEIGPLNDIASVSNTYFHKGLQIEINAELELLD